MKMSDSLKTIKARVAAILERYPETRDSDKLLWLAYMNLNHNLKGVLGVQSYQYLKELIMSDDVPSTESIRRVRQKIQENGLYRGKQRQYRIHESEMVRNWARGK